MNVVIRCPSTGKDVNTGIAADEKSFETMTLRNNTVVCPHCGDPHTWNKEDARLV